MTHATPSVRMARRRIRFSRNGSCGNFPITSSATANLDEPALDALVEATEDIGLAFRTGDFELRGNGDVDRTHEVAVAPSSRMREPARATPKYFAPFMLRSTVATARSEESRTGLATTTVRRVRGTLSEVQEPPSAGGGKTSQLSIFGRVPQDQAP